MNNERINDIKKRVYKLNQELVNHQLVTLTWGNASEIDRELGIIVIKPSGVDYETMTFEDMVVVSLTGDVIDSKYRPSSDLKTHLYLYEKFSRINNVVHTHSTYAVAWAQSRRDIPVYGTTHADHFSGKVYCTRPLTANEINGDYEKETGKVIVETFTQYQTDPVDVPGVLVGNHGPFVWGSNATQALQNAIVIEEVSKMAFLTEEINESVEEASQDLINKHYRRKHGKGAYYGQQ